MRTRPFLATGVLLLAPLGCRNDGVSPTGPATATQADVAATALAFWQVSTAGGHTCAVTSDGEAYCWGQNTYGQLGTGSTSGPETCAIDQGCSLRPAPVATTLRFRQISAGGAHTWSSHRV